MWWKGEYPGCSPGESWKNVDLEEEVQSLERYIEEAVHSMGFTTFNAASDIKIPRCIKFKPVSSDARKRKPHRRPTRLPPVDSQASTSASSAGSGAFSRSTTAAYLPYSAGLGRPGFRLSHSDAPLIRETLLGSGLVQINGPGWVLSWSGGHPKEHTFQQLQEWQRINHFPRSSELTRKDRLWSHYAAMQQLFGAAQFDYLPETFVLPEEMDSFLEVYDKFPSWLWIVKPTSQSRGRGIFILRELEDLPVDSHCVISRYIADPYLIQGYKFDLRVYVLVTGFDPLRVYLYREGLTRLACSPFTVKTTEDLQNKYKHLTNYSICKNSNDYVENSDARADNFGHKWSLSAFNKHCSCSDLDVQKLWGRIIDCVLKTLMASERFGHVGRSGIGSRTAHSCFELFGFDILLDSRLKPWIIEVNLSPSLVADTPLDRKIKAHLVCDILNLVGVPVSSPLGDSYQRYYGSSFASMLSRLPKPSGEGSPRSHGLVRADGMPRKRSARGHDIDEKSFRALVQVLGEIRRHAGHSKGNSGAKNNFIRIYPTPESSPRYRAMLSSQSHHTSLINDVLYGYPQMAGPRGCPRSPKLQSSVTRESQRSVVPTSIGIATGDVRLSLLLLEYCERLCILLESLSPRSQVKLVRAVQIWTKCQSLAAQVPSARPWHAPASAQDFVDAMRARLTSFALERLWPSHARGSTHPSIQAKCRRYVPAAVMKTPTGSDLLDGLAARSSTDIERELAGSGFSPAFSLVMVVAADPKALTSTATSFGPWRPWRVSSDVLDPLRRSTALPAIPRSRSSASAASHGTGRQHPPVGVPMERAQMGFPNAFAEDIDFEV
ncbi:hypothetical protein FOL46_001449 [Perkinsus olseni]|uniref:Tubulin--tyrosine ligase-like protein 5 n=1 Tax=Perkinsus olseni TaxID=32597 RepID=A0A7J6MEM6_PEROL|nr:hypothetical protein FOL46_001449 [Perkinsus olseni]